MATKQQGRVAAVLDNLKSLAMADKADAERISDALESMLDDLHAEDFFGTEGQIDPRGDFRDRKWSMKRVQGVDA